MSTRMRTFVGEMIAVLGLAMLFGPAAALAQKHTPAKVLNGAATYAKHYEPTQKLRLAIVLNPPHMAEERQFLEDVQDKNSPLFHQFLSDDEWNVRFAPTVEDEQAVVDWAQSQGLTLTQRFPNRLVVDVEAPAGTIEKALGVVINNYQVGPDLLYSNDRDPVLPAALITVVDSVLGLNSIERVLPNGGLGQYVPAPDYVAGPSYQVKDSLQKDADPDALAAIAVAPDATNVTAPQSGYWTPKQMFSSAAYNYGALMNQGHCCNPHNNPGNSPPDSSIAIAAYGDLNFKDVSNFQSYFNYLSYNVAKILIDGGYTCGKSDSNCSEVTMDTEWSLAMANSGSTASTAKIFVYEGPNLNQQSQVDLFNFMLKDGHARVMSTSWGGPEGGGNGALDLIFAEMVGKGWTLVAASGDEGAAGGCGDARAVLFPASDPNVVGVGGTTLNEGTGSSYEVAWTGSNSPGACSKNGGGSTGGFSSEWPAPSYQSSFKFAKRAVPDVALEATFGHDVYFDGGWAHLAGTSVAAPMWAGFFAQENAYLLSIGNKCGSGTSPCAPMGNANYPIYEEGVRKNAGRSPFYDIVSGCNSNDITQEFHLTPYCAKTGYDEVTGWGSANMLQMAWAINWELTAATGIPYITFSGPATHTWYNSNQTVSWKVVDYNGGGKAPGTGIAGETQGWDSIPSDPTSEPHGGSGNSFYSGPQFRNDSTGCLAFEANGCSGGVSQGCHTVHVEGWNNQGMSTGDSTYGPLCYDTVRPTVSATLSRAPNGYGWYDQPVTVTLHANDPGGSDASGIKATYYALGSACNPSLISLCLAYTGPFAVSQQGESFFSYFTEDKAGNFSSVDTVKVNLDDTPPVTTSAVTGIFNGGAYVSALTITLKATDNLSGVDVISYFVDGGAWTTYGGPFTVSTPGVHTLKYYSTDRAGNAESAHTLSFTIISPTTTTVTSSLNPSVYGQPVTFTATVTGTLGSAPTGKVTFQDGITPLGTGTLTAGVATLTTAALLNGGHIITASYPGSSTDQISKSASFTQTVEDATATALISSLNPSVYGKTVILKATVTATHGGTVGGTVYFMEGPRMILGSGILNTAGKATFSTSTLGAGAHTLTALYVGNAGDAASRSAALTQTVNKAATTTAMASTLNPSVYGQSVTLTATVSTASPGSIGGPVTFMDGAKSLGVATMNSADKATLSIGTLGAGSHSLTAVFGGNGDYSASTSTALKQTVKQATSKTALSATVNPSAYGHDAGLTATVSSEYGGSVNGTITFMDGTKALGAFAVDPANNQVTYASLLLLPGTYPLTAVYNGSVNDAASTSAAFTLTVKDLSTTTLASSLNPTVFGQSVTLTATVKPLHGGPVGGTVTFKSGATTIVGTATVDAAGKAALITDNLLPGSHALTALYGGSATVEASDSTVLTQTVRDTSETVLSSSLNPSVSGQTVKLMATVILTHGGSFTGLVTFKDGTATLVSVLVNNASTAAISTSTLAEGSHSLTAVFAGNASDAGSTSAALTQVVTGAI